MKQYNLSDLPFFLKKSELFKNFKNDNLQTVPIPDKYVPDIEFVDSDNKIINLDMNRLEHLLEIIRYWMFNDKKSYI